MDTNLKQQAAEEAVTRFVRDRMTLGLGTGSTVYFALRKLGEELAAGRLKQIAGVPTSVDTERQAATFGIPLTNLRDHIPLDVTIDGADEVDDDLNLIKGLGGALLREKLVAASSQKLVIIVDESKHVTRLGSHVPLPVEVAQFAWQVQVPFLKSLGAHAQLRMSTATEPYVTDNGNFILDARFPGGIPDVRRVAEALAHRPGVVEHGLFLGMAHAVVLATVGGVQIMTI
ncbi:MAG: ribose 5-phosphate isomerase A [Chloroflexi bacterium]|nr:ribose 5-phosphate isomerase A [Chloroflexota bacterium]